MKNENVSKRGKGRPAAGVDNVGKPALISHYPQLTIRLQPLLKAQLSAVAHIEGRPGYQIVTECLKKYVDELPKADRAAIDLLTERLLTKPKYQQ